MNWKTILFFATFVLHAPFVRAESNPLPSLPAPPVPAVPPAAPPLPVPPDPLKVSPPPVVMPTPPAAAAQEMAPAYTLLTAMVAEGANIWLPSTLILEGQVPVTLTLRNVSKVEHGFAIEAMGVREIIPAGETKTVVVTPGESGVYRYHCPLHKGHVGGQLLVD